jgi:Lhr-like helicases
MSKNAFDRLAPFIKEYIYRNKWTELRDVQVAACDVIFTTNCNLLLASGTASGKTEAAFLPVLTELNENPSTSIGVLYISPLKALINDQFYRLENLLRDANIPVHKWHGDVSQSSKKKLLNIPQGVLQTTPESLESLLMKKKDVVIKLFSDLQYIIVDEVHYFMSNVRGIQLSCILERIQRLTATAPRRIGLSATLGDYSSAEQWLNSGTNRKCITPQIGGGRRNIKLAMQHFTIKADDKEDNGFEKYLEFLYKNTVGKRSILFANSRGEIEFIMANLKKIAEQRHTPDIYYVHHGSVSASLREYTEAQMKKSEKPIVTGATVTLELGLDIGDLERIVQCGSPYTVSSFVQRLGRTGRRGNPSEMWFAFAEHEQTERKEFYQEINWLFIICIAIIQLYIEERWIEPISLGKYPFNILYHQTMSYMASAGEVSPAQLAQNILMLSPFKYISQDDFRTFLNHLIHTERLQRTDRKGLIVGVAAEKEINHYSFFAVFEAPDEFSVKNGGQEIGTVQTNYPIGEKFALAGRSWEVTELNLKSKTIFVKEIKGITKVGWMSLCNAPMHTKVLQKMQEVISCDIDYKYLSESASSRLLDIRQLYRNAGLINNIIAPLAGNRYAIFPWIGTRGIVALSLALENKKIKNSIFAGSICLLVETDKSKEELYQTLEEIKSAQIDKYSFEIDDNAAIPNKYNGHIPKELLRKQFIEDFIDVDDMQSNLVI